MAAVLNYLSSRIQAIAAYEAPFHLPCPPKIFALPIAYVWPFMLSLILDKTDSPLDDPLKDGAKPVVSRSIMAKGNGSMALFWKTVFRCRH